MKDDKKEQHSSGKLDYVRPLPCMTKIEYLIKLEKLVSDIDKQQLSMLTSALKKHGLTKNELKILEEMNSKSEKSMAQSILKTTIFKLLILSGTSKPSAVTKIQMPPGHFYSTLGKLLLNKKTYERVMEPSILMMQEEHFEYYSQGSFKMAWWVKVRFFFEFLMALGLNLPVVKQMLNIRQKLAK